ncbi:MAG: methyltransferase family protein [Candidatus Hermodarchaeota archaeon]
MKINREKTKGRLSSISTSVSSFLIPLVQYVPCTGVWFGIMSVPFIAYLTLYFQNPGILIYDLNFLYRTYEIYIVIFGFALFIFSLIYQISHRKQLIRTGPYKFVRHPQYLAFIIMTFGMTLIAFQTSPIFNFNLGNLNGYTMLLFIWIAEVFAYVVLAKIEEYALKVKYGDKYLEYVNDVSFMIPFLKFKRNKTEKLVV